MFYIFGHSIKRLIREGRKSLSVPLIAFVLAILVNLLGGIRSWLISEYVDTMENFPIVAVISNLTGDITDGLNIEENIINIFTDPDVPFSLLDFTGELMMKRTLGDVEITGKTESIALHGITSINADSLLSYEYGTEIMFFEGFDESAFLSDEPVCIISEDMYNLAVNGKLSVSVSVQLPDEIIYHEGVHVEGRMDGSDMKYFIIVYNEEEDTYEREFIDPEDAYEVIEGEFVTNELELTVIGIVSGAGSEIVYIPFWTVSAFAEELTDIPPFAESLSVRLNYNWTLSDFKSTAAMVFSRVRPIHGSRAFAMMVYDSEFYETIEPLRQNIIVVDVATPFIYALSIAIGFLTSVLLTRRRKAEFAIMRSIGVNKWVIFISALAEQALLSITGVALGIGFVALAWGYVSLERPAVFLACYLFGALFAAAGAAGTNVMKVLRDRRE